MKTRLFKMAVMAVVLVFGANLSAAELSAPQQVIEKTSNQIKELLKNDRELLNSDPAYVYRMVEDVLVPHFNLDKSASLILGKYWRRTSDEQKTAFKNEFKRMLIRTYATAFNELHDWETAYLPSRKSKKGDRVQVKTRITRTGAPSLAVDYGMNRVDGEWLVYDVKIEGMSLVTNYRNSFKRIIRNSGMGGLISFLEESNNQKSGVEQNGKPVMQKVAFAH